MSKRSSATEEPIEPTTIDLTELDKAHAIAYDLAQQAQKRQLNDAEKALVVLAEAYKPMGEIKPAVFDHEVPPAADKS